MHLSAKFHPNMLWWDFFHAVVFATSDLSLPRLLAAAVDMEPQDFQQLMFDVSGHPRHASMLQACRNTGSVPESHCTAVFHKFGSKANPKPTDIVEISGGLKPTPTSKLITSLGPPNLCIDAMDRGGLQLSIAVTTSFETHGAANCLEGWRWRDERGSGDVWLDTWI